MFGRLNEALQTAADVLAPPPTILQDFEYHWKHVKNFYASNEIMPKVHVNNTNLPDHLEEMLKLLIEEENQRKTFGFKRPSNGLITSDEVSEVDSAANAASKNTNKTTVTHSKFVTSNVKQKSECLNFILTNRPLDLLTDIYLTDSPPGASVCILNWIRRFLSCLQNPRLDHESVLQPIQKMVTHCSRNGGCGSPYEEEEIVFLLTVAGVIRKESSLLHLFLPLHEHLRPNSALTLKTPVKNPLFDNQLETNIRRISLIHDVTADGGTFGDGIETSISRIDDHSLQRSVSIGSSNGENFRIGCDCEESDRFCLFDTILRYFESADSIVVVRACEAALILLSLPSIDAECLAQKQSFQQFSKYLSEKLGTLCLSIPDDMDNGDIEDCSASWGLLPRDSEVQYFIGRAQLMDFLSWLDYTNCVVNECSAREIVRYLATNVRMNLLEGIIEPMISVLDINTAGFALVLTAKIIKQTDSKEISDELANWLVGTSDISEDSTSERINNDCLLNIIIENAQDNLDILLPTLQFIEALLDNTNERILHNMIFRYINNRGYYDAHAAKNLVRTWSDEEDEREKRQSVASGPMKSNTLKPSNILKVINNFLLLLPRQIINDSIGTCYEEYVQDANRHYKSWIEKTKKFNWPIEAVCPIRDDDERTSTAPAPLPSTSSKIELQSCDSGISEEVFYEGPLLRLLFIHVRNMAKHPYELNIAVIAILSKLSFLPHPYLHEILLNPEIPVARGTNTLWSNMQILARQLLLEIPRIEGFQKRITETAKRLLINPPIMSESYQENDPLFESLVALEEFCKELAAIAFVKYHHATE